MGTAVQKEWKRVLAQEEKWLRAGERKAGKPAGKPQEILHKIEEKIPEKAAEALQKAFGKAFFTLFEKGTPLIEKTFSAEGLHAEHLQHEALIQEKPNKKALRNPERAGRRRGRIGVCVATAEGIGLGALGIGLPDIPLFLGVLLKGMYELAAGYGFGYTAEVERVLILRMICAGLAEGTERRAADARVERLLSGAEAGDGLQAEAERAAKALANAMLTMKFIQGLPIVGVAGGLQNPLIYHKVMRYAAMKYKKRDLQRRRTGV